MLNIGVIMYETSTTKGQEVVAQNMVRDFLDIGHNAYLITSPYHDYKKVVSKRTLGPRGYHYEEEEKLKLPVIRVDGDLVTWPPRRIMLHDFVHALRLIVEEYGLNVLITHSTLWNGPEEVVKYMEWRHILKASNPSLESIIYCHMSHFQPPLRRAYSQAEATYRDTWNRLILPQIFRVAHLILVLSPLEKEEMLRLRARAEQCYLFPPGLDEKLFEIYKDAAPESFRQKYLIPPEVPLVSYLGSIEKRKNPLAVIKLAKRVREAYFFIGGFTGLTHAELGRKIKAEASQLENVRVNTRGLTDEEKVQLIKTSYLNILLSKMEGWGIVQAEFMYGGVPVITSAAYGQKFLVRDKVDGFHVKGPNDIEGAAERIKYLIENPDKREEMSGNARERAEGFVRQKLVQGLMEQLNRVKALIESSL